MQTEESPLHQFRNAYLEHRHDGGHEPLLEELDDADRVLAEKFIRMMKACEGVNPYFTPHHASTLLSIHGHNSQNAPISEGNEASRQGGGSTT